MDFWDACYIQQVRKEITAAGPPFRQQQDRYTGIRRLKDFHLADS